MYRAHATSISRHHRTKTTCSARPQPSTTAPQSTFNNLSHIASEMVGQVRPQFTRLQARSLRRSSSKFKCRGSIPKCDQLKEISSIQSWQMVKPLLLIASSRAVPRPNRPILCKSLLSCSRMARASSAPFQEPTNRPVTASSPNILQENRTLRIRSFHRRAAEHLISVVLTRQLMWAPRWSTLIWKLGRRPPRMICRHFSRWTLHPRWGRQRYRTSLSRQTCRSDRT